MSTLTPRQEQVLERLEKSMSAQEIADDLGVSRNAVYQQIQAIRRKGALAPTYTPSGAPPRGVPAANTDEPAVFALASQMRDAADELERIASTLRQAIGA